MSYPILEKIGLSPKEAEVYEVLLKLGESPVSDILKETQDHPQVVYRAIDSLLAQGLVIETFWRHRKYVRAEDPRVFEQRAEKNLEELRINIPELLALQKSSQDAIVRVAKGNEAVRSLRLRAIDTLSDGDTLYIIGASGDRYYEIMADQHAEIERKRIKKRICRKLISLESQKTQLERDHFKDLTEFHFLSEEFPIPSSTNIFANTTAIIIWEPEPIVIAIESKEVAESYVHYFHSLWKIN